MRADRNPATTRQAAIVPISVVQRSVPALLGIALVVPSIVWVSLDRSIWPWDPAWYGEISVDLWATLRIDATEWPASMVHAFGAKPPAIAWLGQFFVPVGRIIGNQQVGMLLSVLACQAVTIALVYAACRRLRTDWIASLAAALLVAASPLFVSASHEYFAEPVQTVAVAWCLFVLSSARGWPLALTSAQLPGVVALAMLAKLSSPAYLAAPVAAVAVLAVLGRRDGDPPRERARNGVVVASAVTSGLLASGAIAWYAINLDAALDHARIAGSDSGLYGVDHGFARQLPEWFDRFADGALLPHFGPVLLVLLTASVVIAARARPRMGILDDRVVAVAACLITILVVLSLFASQPNTEVRYLLPLTPLLALAFGIVLSAPGSRPVAGVAVAVLAAELAFVNLQSFGTTPFSSLSYYRLVAPVDDSALSTELDRIVDATCTTETANRISMVGAEHPWFNANTLTLIAAEHYAQVGRRCYYTSLGYAEASASVAWKRVKDFAPPFYVSIDYGNRANRLPDPQRSLIVASDPFNRVNRAVYRRALRSGLFEPIPGSRRAGIVILRARAG